MEYDDDHSYCKPSTSKDPVEEKLEQKYCFLHGNKLAQQFVKRIHDYFVQEQHKQPIQETAKALQISLPSVIKYKDGPIDKALTPVVRKRKSAVNDLREGKQVEIRNEIYEMYAKKMPVTLTSLKDRLFEKEIYTGKRTSLYRVLKNAGFSYQKDNPRLALMEKPDIAAKRRRFLEYYMLNESFGQAKKPCVFLDETWIFANGSHRKSWQDDDIRSIKRTTGEGHRFIVLHAGTEKGFVRSSSLIFKSKQKTGDYHGEMNSENFEKWVKDSLLPSLEEPSIIIIDNAPYHSRDANPWPTTSWNKNRLQEWLKEKKIDYLPSETIPQLRQKIGQKPDKTYVVDNMIMEAGHEVLRLPPYHCQFNAIEMVWSQAKRYYDKHIGHIKEPLLCWDTALNSVTELNWYNYVSHTDKIIKQSWEKEREIITVREPLIIHVDVDSENSFSDTD